MALPTGGSSKLAQTVQVKDIFPEDYGYKDSKEGSKTTLTRWTLLFRKAKDSAVSVLKTLYQNKINAVPVYDAEGKKWLGFVDDQDLVLWAFRSFFAELRKETGTKEPQPGAEFQLLTELESKSMFEKLQKMGNFVETVVGKSNTTAADVGSFTGRNAWHPVKWTDSIYAVLEVFATTKVRRVPVVGDNGQVQHVITRSDLVDWTLENLGHYPELKTCPLFKLASAKKDAYTLPLSARAADAFRLMALHNVSAIGVIDGEGKVVCNVKLTDVKRAEGNIGPRLHLPMNEYYQLQEKKRNLILSNLAAFGGAVNMLCQHTARRMFVFDPNTNRPVGVFSQIDAIDELYRYLSRPDSGSTTA